MIPLRPGILLLPLLLAGCQGTPFGDRLSASFPGGPAADAQAPRQAPAAATGTARPGSATAPPSPTTPQVARPGSPSAPGPSASPAARPPGPVPPSAGRPAAQPAQPATPAPARAAATAPYRITLRLPLADPAAPAEGVTQALRAAGVPFEVETIERMNPANPTAAGPDAGAPVVRPAPTPR